MLATLQHPNIVKYYESFLDNHDGRLLIVMELCEVLHHPCLPVPTAAPCIPGIMCTRPCQHSTEEAEQQLHLQSPCRLIGWDRQHKPQRDGAECLAHHRQEVQG